MEFGKVPENQLNTINFSLPPEPPGNRIVLGGKAKEQAKVYIGAARWGSTEWPGKIYPAKTKDKDFLSEYVKHFSCIELNATHYKVNDAAAIHRWAEKADGKDFKFCPKMFKGVTHQGGLGNKGPITNQYLNGIAAFGEHLGPIFIQLSDSFSPFRREELFTYLQSLPREMSFLLELRHPEWFTNEAIKKELFNKLYHLKIGTVISDTSGRRDCVHMHVTIPQVMIRFVANNMHPTDYPRIDEWAQRIKEWLQEGMEEIYFIVHTKDDVYSPEIAVYVADKLHEVCGLDLLKPTFIKPGSLAGGEQIKFFE